MLPFVPIYFLVTWLRNTLYDFGWKPSKSYSVPVVCVGNLSVGGTGKTPMIEYLIRLLKHEYKIATLSRGYKRKTKGFQLADETCTVASIGDEPFQFYNKFKSDVLVAVDANRQNGIEQLQEHDPDVILLDDAFQHRKVKAGLNILLTTYNAPYFKDILLPTGNLREPRSGAKRAQIIVVTKCPHDLNTLEKKRIIEQIKPEAHQAVFFSSIAYAEQICSVSESMALHDLKSGFTLVTGIANPTSLIEFLKAKQFNFDHLNFQDHHEFSEVDIVLLEQKEMILTTEKDFMRLKQYETLKDKLYYLPIQVKLDYPNKFNALIEKAIKR
ncbi:tetraacyldisaccharide 4'-kinase [Tamlana fucoidanivorans]|uniref:tetraacyldisaccharide 4'-kinase n=1 Tax=Allotamlana fucoidanivorans TaxID=2583814 RepID=UPI0029391690|nr:tetraacyldisaccharide 4'-kinase [Tamlana fucoidanivorans]